MAATRSSSSTMLSMLARQTAHHYARVPLGELTLVSVFRSPVLGKAKLCHRSRASSARTGPIGNHPKTFHWSSEVRSVYGTPNLS